MRKTRKSKPLTIRRVRAVYVEIIEELKQELATTQQELSKVRYDLAQYKAAERWREQEKEMQWEAFDRCNDEATSQELALFEASPAYKKYQQWREGYEMRGTGDWRLKTGDWYAP